MGDIGHEAKTAVPALIELLKDEDGGRAVLALWAIGPAAKDAVPTLIEILKDQDERIRQHAALALGQINTPEAQKALEEYEKNSN